MTIKILGVDVDMSSIDKLLEKPKTDFSAFDTTSFKKNLDEYRKLVNTLEKAGSAYQKELTEAKRTYDNLIKINTWFMQYNRNDEYPISDIIRVKRLVCITAIQNFKELNLLVDQCAYFDNLFVVLDLYIIPYIFVFPRGKRLTSDKKIFERLREISRCASVSRYQKTGIALPEDGYYGSIRHISPTHFAVVVNDENNPFAKQAQSANAWRFIASDGQPV